VRRPTGLFCTGRVLLGLGRSAPPFAAWLAPLWRAIRGGLGLRTFAAPFEIVAELIYAVFHFGKSGSGPGFGECLNEG